MLATFASMLPNGIVFTSSSSGSKEDAKDKDTNRDSSVIVVQPPQPIDKDIPRDTDHEPDVKVKDMGADEMGVKKKRERGPNETFIVVRPPPSVSNHPLNLQLQLVPPQVKDRSVSRRSIDTDVTDAPTTPTATSTSEKSVGRSASIRSNRSDVSSFYSSSASMTSVSSLASSASSTASGRRMIVPLYNLSAHNVMTNTVLDAGTDAKVAKFGKRGMEVIGLAVLEPLEVWGVGAGNSSAAHADALGRVGSKEENDPARMLTVANLEAREATSESAHTPTSSALSLSSIGFGDAGGTTTFTVPTDPNPTPTPSSAKKLFGKIFKRRESGDQPGHSRSGSLTSFPLPTTPQFARRSFNPVRSGTSPATASNSPTTPRQSPATPRPIQPASFQTPPVPPSPPNSSSQPTLQPPVLGIQSVLISPIHPPVGRPTRYIWIVRKWLKGGEGGLLGGVNVGINVMMKGVVRGFGGNTGDRSGSASALDMGEGVEVRFEWVRGQHKLKRVSTQPGNRSRRTSVHFTGEGHGLGKALPPTPEKQSPSKARPGTSGSGRSPSPLALTRPGLGPHEGSGSSHLSSSSHGPQNRWATDMNADRDRESMTTSVDGSEEGTWEGAASGKNKERRPSRSSPRTSGSHTRGTSAPHGSSSAAAEDDGEESDPEDSETPWSCTLTINAVRPGAAGVGRYEQLERELLRASSRTRGSGGSPAGSHLGAPPLAAQGSASSAASGSTYHTPPVPGSSAAGASTSAPPLLRVKIATLSPTPHHPKVVAQMKVPFPLPDIEVDRARVQRRVVGPNGIPVPALPLEGERDGPGRGGGEGLVLTAEEIKDVLSSTAFWLVVREGMGGVGKVPRRGDGWRIRG